jgi:hypothetical protein
MVQVGDNGVRTMACWGSSHRTCAGSPLRSSRALCQVCDMHLAVLYVVVCYASQEGEAGAGLLLADIFVQHLPGLAYRLPVSMDAPVSPPEGRPMPVIIFSHG